MSTAVLAINPTMKYDRRQFLKSSGKTVVAAGALGATALSIEGCNAQVWLQTAINDMPAILQIVGQIVNIVGLYSSVATPTIQAEATKIGTEIQTDLINVQTWVKQYQSASSTTLLGEIYAALSTTQTNLGQLLSMLHVYNTQWQTVLGVAVSSAMAAIVAIQTLMPIPAVATVTAQRRAAHKALQSNDPSVALKLFYNEAILAAGGQQFAIAM